MRLTKADIEVLRQWTDGGAATEPIDSKKLTAIGPRLSGNWLGGNRIAEWVQDNTPRGISIVFHDLGSKASQTVQRRIRQMVPAAWIVGTPQYNALPRGPLVTDDDVDVSFHEEERRMRRMRNPMRMPRDVVGGKVLATTFEDRELLMNALEAAIYVIVNRRRHGEFITQQDEDYQTKLEELFNRIAAL